MDAINGQVRKQDWADYIIKLIDMMILPFTSYFPHTDWATRIAILCNWDIDLRQLNSILKSQLIAAEIQRYQKSHEIRDFWKIK